METKPCRSGHHDPNLQQSYLLDFPVNHNLTVPLCDQCFCAIMRSKRENVDPTSDIMYLWAKQCGDTKQLPTSLKNNGLKQAEVVEFVNMTLANQRSKNANFPVILTDLSEKDEFIQTIRENKDTLQRIIHDVLSDRDRKNIALRLWAGCLDAAKTLRYAYVSERNPDGTTKREEPITPQGRHTAFTSKIDHNAKQDPIYNAGVESAPIWELKTEW
jgi:hypothetical protein